VAADDVGWPQADEGPGVAIARLNVITFI
jgi:hypothetical protein